MTEDEKYWEEKVKAVSRISKRHGFPEQNVEFWKTQPAGVISLIFEVLASKASRKFVKDYFKYTQLPRRKR